MLSRNLLLILLVHACGILVVNGLSPILLVPGWTDSQLEAKISDGSSCDTGGKWHTYWVNDDMPVKCINKVLTLQYNETTNTYYNSTGVQVRVPGFGDTDAVEHLNPNGTQRYYDVIVDYFVKKGYERGKTIRAAPYDWRLAADSLNRTGFYQAFKKLVEEMYEDANNAKVSIVVHSMGGPVTLYFFNNIVTQDWKDKYINVYVPLSGAWSGGNGVILTYISAERAGREKPFGTSFQKMESTVWLMPNPLVWTDEVLVTTKTNKYSANTYKQLFTSINRTVDYVKLNKSFTINGQYSSPNVPVHCFYGTNVPTVKVVHYDNGLTQPTNKATFGDGDEAVNLLSSEVCLKWSDQSESFTAKRFPFVSHGEMISSPRVLKAIEDAIENPKSVKEA